MRISQSITDREERGNIIHHLVFRNKQTLPELMFKSMTKGWLNSRLKHISIHFDHRNKSKSHPSRWSLSIDVKYFLRVYLCHFEVNVQNEMPLQGPRGPKTHKCIYYYLCEHVILLSNEPFTVSIMKQLALAQDKWTAWELPCLRSEMKADVPQPKHQCNRLRCTEEQKGLWVSVILISSLTPLENSPGQTSLCENNA